ncbi:MAG TPA: hypothetical protein VLJ86_01085, partial [Ramlibacter sp.]|nr:hypothetical protein [Ramlibacter sp.]
MVLPTFSSIPQGAGMPGISDRKGARPPGAGGDGVRHARDDGRTSAKAPGKLVGRLVQPLASDVERRKPYAQQPIAGAKVDGKRVVSVPELAGEWSNEHPTSEITRCAVALQSEAGRAEAPACQAWLTDCVIPQHPFQDALDKAIDQFVGWCFPNSGASSTPQAIHAVVHDLVAAHGALSGLAVTRWTGVKVESHSVFDLVARELISTLDARRHCVFESEKEAQTKETLDFLFSRVQFGDATGDTRRQSDAARALMRVFTADRMARSNTPHAAVNYLLNDTTMSPAAFEGLLCGISDAMPALQHGRLKDAI